MNTQIGKDLIRKEAFNKVTGAAKYTDDFIVPSIFNAKLLTSPHAHAKIVSIDTEKAKTSDGVKAVITGNDIDLLFGPLINDRPPLAKEKVRYFGEPVAIVVADSEQNAASAAEKITVKYEQLQVVNKISDAIKQPPVLIHENLMNYKKSIVDVYPEQNTNICDRVKMRKGDMQKGWAESEVTVECSFKLPQSDHAAMEIRAARCEILPDGRVFIKTSSQAPFSDKSLISENFNLPEGNVIVEVPLVGGGFGGKVPADLEILAYIASNAVGGHAVKISNSREEDMATFHCKNGFEATLKIGAKKDGKITAAEINYCLDCGAYSDTGPKMAKAAAVDCVGPYNVENLQCDTLCVYTNHTPATSYRGFGHVCPSFCIERMMDKLAEKLNIDPLRLRTINALKENDFTPSQVKVTLSNTGNFSECLTKLKTLINWDEGQVIKENNNLVRAKGIGCFNKTSNSPTDAVSGVLITFNTDGSVNLNCGAVECGPGMKTTAAQMLAEALKMDVSRIFVNMDVNTQISPKHWKTVASMTTFMLGRAIINAAEDLKNQILSSAAAIMKCRPSDLEIKDEKVILSYDPGIYVQFKDLVHGFQYPEGNSVLGQILGRGSYIMHHLTFLDKETGKGKPGPSYTVGAQAVEILYDTIEHTYRILKAATVIDAGKVLNPKTAKGIIMGAVSMGLGLATSEEFLYDKNAVLQNTGFRTYKMLRYGENPDYLIEFVETPQIDAPFGARGIAEHGILGMSGALANAISKAANVDITELPITPESIWRKAGGLK